MSFTELFIIAVGLSMDAFAISISKGLALERCPLPAAAVVGGWFGFFQALMPVIGYLAAFRFSSVIESFDHWAAFVLLGILGGRMIWGVFSKGEDEEKANSALAAKEMFLLSVATSIDALMAGVTFAFLSVSIVPAALFIGITTFAFGVAGARLGSFFGQKIGNAAQIFGGVILVGFGVKILLDHLGILAS